MFTILKINNIHYLWFQMFGFKQCIFNNMRRYSMTQNKLTKIRNQQKYHNNNDPTALIQYFAPFFAIGLFISRCPDLRWKKN